MRINARLDNDRAQKLEFLTRSTRQGTTEIIKLAIDVFYEKVSAEQPKPLAVFERVGFIGCGEAPVDLSSTYKEELSEILANKPRS